MSVFYNVNIGYSWQYLNPYFDLIETNKIKIEFYKRTDPFPFRNSDPIEWSVEVKNLRCLYSISIIDEFVPTDTVDLLGNFYKTSLSQYFPQKRFKDKTTKYWKSQVNPDPFAVEALYFDITDENNNAVYIDEIFGSLSILPNISALK